VTALRARFGAVIGTLAVCALVLTGCAAGKKAPTAEETPAIDGTNASIGKLLLREVAIAAPKDGPSYAQGSNANLQLVIVNTGTVADSLTAVSTSAAGSVSVTSVSSATASSGASGSGSASGSASGSSSTSSSATESSGSSSAAAGSFAPVELAPNSSVSFGIGSGTTVLVLNSLKAQLFPAAVVSVTFQFQNAGSLTVEVPVQLTASENPGGQTVTAGLTPESSASE
jgi:copper(I)-binding protein